MWHALSTAVVRMWPEMQSIGFTNYHQQIYLKKKTKVNILTAVPYIFWVLVGHHQLSPVFTFFLKKSPNATDWGRNM